VLKTFQPEYLKGYDNLGDLGLHGSIVLSTVLKCTDLLKLYDMKMETGFIHLWLYSPLLELGRFFSFLNYTQLVGLLGRGKSPSQGRYLHTGQYKQNKRTQASMPLVGFEPTIPAFEQAKTVHALHRAATMIGRKLNLPC
jgi:hypothetical protein